MLLFKPISDFEQKLSQLWGKIFRQGWYNCFLRVQANIMCKNSVFLSKMDFWIVSRTFRKKLCVFCRNNNRGGGYQIWVLRAPNLCKNFQIFQQKLRQYSRLGAPWVNHFSFELILLLRMFWTLSKTISDLGQKNIWSSCHNCTLFERSILRKTTF